MGTQPQAVSRQFQPKKIAIWARTWLFVYGPILAGLLIMAPRLASAEFGLFDDGITLQKSREITSGVWEFEFDAMAGRSRPAYWLYFASIYALVGEQPFWFFAGNALLLSVTILAIVLLVRAGGGTRAQAGLSGLLFALANPVIENFYTLSKGEPLQLMMLGLSLLAVLPFERLKPLWAKVLLVLVSGMLVFLGSVAKETGVLVLPISLAWLASTWWAGKRQAGIRRTGTGLQTSWPAPTVHLAYSIAAALGVAATLAYRLAFVSTNPAEGTYTSDYIFGLGPVLISTVRWAGWLLRDFAYGLPVTVLMLAWFFSRREVRQSRLLVEAGIWTAAWLAVYLPWTFAAGYYLLPFAAGFAVWTAVLITQAYGLLVQASRSWKYAAAACLGLTGILFVLMLGGNLSTMQLQIAMDEANAGVLDHLSISSPPGSTVLVNIQYLNEYVYEVRRNLNNLKKRPDISVDLYKFQTLDPADPALEPHLIISPYIENQPALPVRMGVVENTQAQWNDTLHETLDENWKLVYRTERSFRLTSFNLPRIFCPLARSLDYCTAEIPLVDTRVFRYGWEVYQMEMP